MRGEACPRHVHVRAGRILFGEAERHFRGGRLLARRAGGHADVIIMVGQRDRAFAGGDGLDLGNVPALRRTGEVRHHAIGPGLGGIVAHPADQFAHQGKVIDIGRGPHADLTLEARAGEVAVMGHFLGFHAGRVIGDHAHPAGKAVPVTIFLAEMLGDDRIKRLILQWLQQARCFESVQCAGIGRNHDIRRARVAFGLHRLQQFRRARFAEADLDAGLSLELLVHVLVGIIVPRRVNVQHARVCGLVP